MTLPGLRILGLVLPCLLFFSWQAQAAELRKPNIIFILADDLGWRDLGCYGSTFLHPCPLPRGEWESSSDLPSI